MRQEKIDITLDESYIRELDRLVNQHVFQSHNQAIQEGVSKKLMPKLHSYIGNIRFIEFHRS
jgi:hypothetical protein